METLETLFCICLGFLPKFYYNTWPMCLVFLHGDELQSDLAVYKIIIFRNVWQS